MMKPKKYSAPDQVTRSLQEQTWVIKALTADSQKICFQRPGESQHPNVADQNWLKSKNISLLYE